jgi:hypothetical protein
MSCELRDSLNSATVKRSASFVFGRIACSASRLQRPPTTCGNGTCGHRIHGTSLIGCVPTGPTTHTLIAYWDRLILKAKDGGTEALHTLSPNATLNPSGVHSVSQRPKDCAEVTAPGHEMIYACSCTASTTHPRFSWLKS